MEWRHCFSCIFLLFFSSILVCVSASLSDGIFVNQATTGRNLLQAKKPCPISFEFQNYTVITSQCRGPQYPAKQCCAAFVEFACPFSDFLNDLSNDCASTMFSYINLHGKYPPGIFANACKGDKLGLACPGLAPSESANANKYPPGLAPSESANANKYPPGLAPSESANANNSHMSCRLSPMLMIAIAFMGLLLLLL